MQHRVRLAQRPEDTRLWMRLEKMCEDQWSTVTVPGGIGFARPQQWHPCGGWEGERARKDPTKSFTRPLSGVSTWDYSWVRLYVSQSTSCPKLPHVVFEALMGFDTDDELCPFIHW